jgi:hypothetical protein
VAVKYSDVLEENTAFIFRAIELTSLDIEMILRKKCRLYQTVRECLGIHSSGRQEDAAVLF